VPPRECIELGCRQFTTVRSRCVVHQSALEQRKQQRRPVSYAERVRRAKVVANHIHLHGYVCPGCPLSDGKPHPADPDTNPLTADHYLPVAEGGPEDGPLRVMCLRGNSSRVSRNRRNRR
jgi:hypothetical protein